MNPHALPAALSVADRASLKYPPTVNPLLISFLINHSMAAQVSAPVTMAPKQLLQEQQRVYVNALVDVTVQTIASIWPSATNTPQSGNRPIADLNTFLHHILRHSRTTHSTLQLAIFYLFRIRPRVLERRNDDIYIACGRRMFLAALICAHKFLQDKTYKNSAWSKVSGLSVTEVNHAERVMLHLLDWSLFVKKDTYDQWIHILQSHLQMRPPMTDGKDNMEYLHGHFVPHPFSACGIRSAAYTLDAGAAATAHAPAPASTPASVSVSKSTTKATTVVHLGMATPVEELKSTIHHHTDIGALPSPPERKRKRSIGMEPVSKRRA